MDKLAALDILKEIGTIGAGRAATALSEMISSSVEITVPEAEIIPTAEFTRVVTSPEKTYIVMVICLEGELGGRVFFLMAPDDARLLGSTLLGIKPEEVTFDNPLFQSSIKEALNIIVGAYMMALSEMTKLEIMFSIPYLALDVLTALFIADQTPQKSNEIFLIKTLLKIKGKDFDGVFFFFPDLPSIQKIFRTMGLEYAPTQS